MSITRIVFVAYRPKPGMEQVLLSEVRDHYALLWSEGLATGRDPVLMQAKDGTVIEMFEWASPAAIEEAHANPRVQAMWARFEKICDYVPLGALPEAGEAFAEFEPLTISFPPMPRPGPDEREE